MITWFEIWGYALSYLEAFSFIFLLVCVYLNTRENVWAWPLGIIGVSLYMVICMYARLYADFGLQIVYIFLSFYGWYEWLYGGKNKSALRVSRLSAGQWMVAVIVITVCTPIMGWLLDTWTDTDVGYLDSFTTVTSLVAQYMLAKKIIENWWLWIIADVVYVGLFVFRELYLLAILYTLFLILCVVGLNEWKKSILQVDTEMG